MDKAQKNVRGQTLIFPPYTLEMSNNYTISYKVKDLRNIKDEKGNPREKETKLTFSIIIRPLNITLTANKLSVNITDQLVLTGLYEDPDFKAKSGPHIK